VVPCSDAAGDVVEVGEGVVGFAPGDRVVAAFGPAILYGPSKNWNSGLGGPVDGVMREYIALPAQSVVKIPESSTLSYAQWASVVCTGVTAWNALYGNVPLKPGQTVLFQGKPSSLKYVQPSYTQRMRINSTDRYGWSVNHWSCAGQSGGCNDHHHLLFR
jgi:NADPH:quinone reductase-like Zn-dependent oxidoreductase